MIFNFSFFGTENEVVQFEQNLMKILLRLFKDDEMLANEVHFCVHEAVLNIMQHSYYWDSSKPIDVRLAINEGEAESEIEIQIIDQGTPIEKVLQIPGQIETFQMRKRGLYMIGQIMDFFSVSPAEKKGNVTKMRKIICSQPDKDGNNASQN